MSGWVLAVVVMVVTALTLALLDALLAGLEAISAWRARPALEPEQNLPRRLFDGATAAAALLVQVPTGAALSVLLLELLALLGRGAGLLDARPAAPLVVTVALAGALAGAACVGVRRVGAARRGAMRGVAVLALAALAGAATAWSPLAGPWGAPSALAAALAAAVLASAGLLSRDDEPRG